MRLLSFCSLIISVFAFGCATTTLHPPAELTVSPSSALLVPGQTAQFTATGDTAPLQNPVWSVNGVVGGSATTGTIAGGLYKSPATPLAAPVQITMTEPALKLTSPPATVSTFDSTKPVGGTVGPSNNPLVATYIVNAPQGATVQVQFGTTTNYGLTTWAQPAPVAGGVAAVLVAGMRASTAYHMKATVTLPGGQTNSDVDHTFTTGALPESARPSLAILQPSLPNAQPGIELLDLAAMTTTSEILAFATDLEGNVIWYYPVDTGVFPFPVKLLDNGHMLVVLDGASTEIREVDLAGNLIYQITKPDFIAALAAAGLDIEVANFHHDIQKLPNGHLLILVNYTKTFEDVPNVIGDALIEWDIDKKAPVWTWSTFDHLSLTHAPMGTNDWTHSNAVVYSPTDGNLILSMRNQNWVIKINYQDGAGDGSILWRMGPGGDFTLPSSQSVTEFNYAQHYPTVTTPNSSGIFRLMVFNNGNNRLEGPNELICGTTGAPACYSSVPEFELNESAHTAQVVEEQILAPSYSTCCGNAEILPNGNLEYDIAFDVNTPNVSHIQELALGSTPPQLVWQMDSTGPVVYRGFRIGSLYPGVTWTPDSILTANTPAAKTK
jgi:arylsulfate sulfotransferase